MHLFSWNTLYCYFLHSMGFFFTMASIFGIPGKVYDTNLKIKKITEIYNIFLNLAWVGIPFAMFGSILAMIFNWKIIWNTFPYLSLVLGLCAFFCMFILHRIK